MPATLTALVVAVFMLPFLSACGGQQAVKPSEPAPAAPAKAGAQEAPLDNKYSRIVFEKFEVDSKIEADYPGAVAECEHSAVAAVKEKNLFQSVEQGTPGGNRAGLLQVKTRVTSLRIVSGAARFWGGAFAGSSDMTLEMTLIDGVTGREVRRKTLSTANNPWGAAWTFGGSDRSLPSDLGKMVGEYLSGIQPKR
jgi:hypothetical protein